MVKVWLHSTGEASSGAALLLPQILRVFSVVAPCPRGASPVSVRRQTFTTGCILAPFEGALYELEGENACVDVGTDRWSDVTPALSTGSWVATLPAIGSVVIDTAIADSRGLRSRTSILLGSGAAREIDRAPGADGTEVLSTELTRTRGGRPVFRLALDRPVVAARARLKPGGARSSVRVCAQEMFPLFADGASQADLSPDFESEAYFGPGWGDAERTATGRVRRGEDRATLLLPLQRGYDYRLSLDLAGAAGTRIDIALNNDAIGACALGAGVPCEVALPRGAVRDGTNTLTLTAQGSSPLTFQSGQILRQAVEASLEAPPLPPRRTGARAPFF